MAKQPKDYIQYHLTGAGFSGRAVRVRRLSATEKDSAAVMASKQSDGDAAKYQQIKLRECVTRMLISVTEPGMKDAAAVLAAKFSPVTMAELQDPTSPRAYDSLFTTKDDDALCYIYRTGHEASVAEVEAIMGKALMVSGD